MMSQVKTLKNSGTAISSAGWMITFADLLSLMLTFFVLVFSMSSVQLESWDDVVKTMRKQFNPAAPLTPRNYEIERVAVSPASKGLNLNYLRGLLENALSQSEKFGEAKVFVKDDKVIASVPSTELFENKSSAFVAGSVEALERLSGTFLNVNNKILVEAHTNDIAMPEGSTRTNWELSVIRARLVAGVLADTGYTRELTVLGHGDSKFEGAGQRVSIAELEAQERVDFVFLPEGRGRGAFDVF